MFCAFPCLPAPYLQIARSTPTALIDSELFSSDIVLEDLLFTVNCIQCFLPDVVSIGAITEVLLHAAPQGPALIVTVLANLPEQFSEVVSVLAQAGGGGSNENGHGPWTAARREEALHSICLLAPHHTAYVRELLLSRRVLPRLIVRLTLDLCKDTISFLSGLLPDRTLWPWLVGFLRRDDTGLAAKMYTMLVGYNTRPFDDVTAMASLARLYCALMSSADTKLTLGSSEIDTVAVVDFLTAKRAASPTAARMIRLSLCAFASCPALNTPERSEVVTAWLSGLLDDSATRKADAGEAYAEMLLLMAVHFQAGNMKAVADLVRGTLGFHLDLPIESLKRLGGLFTAVFPHKALAPLAVAVAVTPALHAGMRGFLPAHCVHHALRSRIFVMQQVQPKDWILQQVLAASPDHRVHPLLPLLVQGLADFATEPQGTALSGNDKTPRQEHLALCMIPLHAIGEDALAECFKTGSTVAQVLMLLYVLTYNSAVDARTQRLRKFPRANAPATPPKYGSTLLEVLPIKRLLMATEVNQAQYSDVFSPLLSLVAVQYPELLDASALVRAEEQHTDSPSANQPTAHHGAGGDGATDDSGGRAAPALDIDCAAKGAAALVELQRLAQLPADRLRAFAPTLVNTVLPQMLKKGTHRRIQAVFCSLWERLNLSMPRTLWLLTVRCLQGTSHQHGVQELSHDDLISDPLLVLRCDRRAFSLPDVLKIILVVLKGYMDASQATLASRCTLSNAGSSDLMAQMDGANTGAPEDALNGAVKAPTPEERNEFLSTLVMTQDAAVVQMLFELCLSLAGSGGSGGNADRLDESTAAGGHATEAGANVDVGMLQEVRIVICSFVHQLFIANPLLLKLVHFQGYNPNLLPVFAVGIPSMHICIGFLAELLVQPALHQQIFAVQLAGQLAKRYPIPEMLQAARTTVGKMHELANANVETRDAFFRPTLPSLVHLCTAFPLLCESVIELLLKVLSVARAHIAVHCHVEAAHGSE